MIVYHASNCEVKVPMLVASNRLLDFGPGFYTTTNREQAIRFAKGVVCKRGGDPFLNVYEFDAEAAYARLLTLRFDAPTEQWLDFVVANRSGTYVGERYDLVSGPVANDNVVDWEGAGDWTSSAFIAEYLKRGYRSVRSLTEDAVREILFEAQKVASRSVSFMGSKGMISNDTK